ncbi:MAG: radical SAM protein [Cyclobacteriaceae bacterium]|nr:radical SAM protein [Cyclobacteriaceae bacterium]
MDSTTLIGQEVYTDAFEVRKKNFDDVITFHAPGLKKYNIPEFEQKNPRAFLPISITGNGCALNCDHCDSKILDPMLPLNLREGLFNMAQRLAKEGTEAILISGGSQKDGKVPFLKHIGDITRIKKELGLKIIMHTGLVDEEMAINLKNAGVDGVALDIIGDNQTIKEVYHLDNTVEDFDKSLEVLTKHGLSIRPHIILGLHYGKFLGEYKALEMISKYPTHALILVILTPLHGTPMYGIDPPDTEEVARFFRQARMTMPDSRILLGCARPAGDYKKVVDMAAVDAGLNGIAFPAEGVVNHAISKGLKPGFFENSCSCGVD